MATSSIEFLTVDADDAVVARDATASSSTGLRGQLNISFGGDRVTSAEMDADPGFDMS